jgi:hypothetical protein
MTNPSNYSTESSGLIIDFPSTEIWHKLYWIFLNDDWFTVERGSEQLKHALSRLVGSILTSEEHDNQTLANFKMKFLAVFNVDAF